RSHGVGRRRPPWGPSRGGAVQEDLGARPSMRELILRRAVALVATLFVVSLLVFTVVRVLPGDPALLIMGTEASPEAAAALRSAMGLDRPILVQYVEWLGGALRGGLGRSIQYDVAGGRLVSGRPAGTLPLPAPATAFLGLAPVPPGVCGARAQGRSGGSPA